MSALNGISNPYQYLDQIENRVLRYCGSPVVQSGVGGVVSFADNKAV